MNCIEVRRQLLSEPSSVNEAIHAHLHACADCARFAKGLLSFEHALKEAAQVPVPEGLASRILFQQRIQAQRKPRRWIWLALAASLFLVVGVVISLGDFTTQSSLEASVLAHIEHEPHHLQDRNNVSLAELNTLLKTQGLRLDGLTARVNYAGPCQMRRQPGVHMVLDGSTGPVSVLLMPGEYIDQRKIIKNQDYQGVIVPIPQGSMAIIGQDPGQVQQLEQILSTELVSVI